MMRKISKISVHCMKSNRKHHDNVETIHQWHVNENGWKMVGYHIFIDSTGKPWDEHNHKLMRPYSMIPSAVKNHNSGMVAICLWGNDEKDFTPEQIYTLRQKIRELRKEYELERWSVKGHNEYSGHETRGCPGMNVQKTLFGTRGVQQTY